MVSYETFLDNPHHKTWRKIYNFIQVCVVVSILSLMFASIDGITRWYLILFFIVDFIVSCIFCIEYFYRLKKAKSKKIFFYNWRRWIDFLSFFPFFIILLFPFLFHLEALKILRIIRVLRIINFTNDSPLIRSFMRTIHTYKEEYTSAFSLFFTILILSSSVVFYFEHQMNSDFASIFHSLWWGVVTMTTVWYGDMTPITLWGRIVGSFVILLWPILLAMVSSITFLVFKEVANEQRKKSSHKICIACKALNPKYAIFCNQCGRRRFETIKK